MVKKPFRGNHIILENVRVFYDEKKDAVILTSKDKDIPAHKSFSITLNNGREAEYILRDLLSKAGKIPKDKNKSLPKTASYEKSHYHKDWEHFPLGIQADGTELIWWATHSGNLLLAGPTGSGKSNMERNLIFHCLNNPDKWQVTGIDLRRVNLSAYAKYPDVVKRIATNREEADEALVAMYTEMMERYDAMDRAGVTSYQDLSEPPHAQLILIDDVYMLHASSDSLESIERYRKIEELLRLGRAAGIHVVISVSSPIGIINQELLLHIPTRILTTWMNSAQSELLLGNKKGTRIDRTIKGRGHFQEFGEGTDFQAYYAEQSWIDKQRKEKG